MISDRQERVLVVLIHGLGRGTASMPSVAWRLGRAGWPVERIGYRSTRMRLAQAIEVVRAMLGQLAVGWRGLCLVGHSLGGLISAHILRDPRGLPIQRIVQIGAPNLGSPVADRMSGFGPVRRACGPVLDDLRAHNVGPARLDTIGAIAGTAGLSIHGSGLARPHDGAVTVRSAIAGAGHRAAAPVPHSFLPLSAAVARQTGHFLENGAFAERRP